MFVGIPCSFLVSKQKPEEETLSYRLSNYSGEVSIGNIFNSNITNNTEHISRINSVIALNMLGIIITFVAFMLIKRRL